MLIGVDARLNQGDKMCEILVGNFQIKHSLEGSKFRVEIKAVGEINKQ